MDNLELTLLSDGQIWGNSSEPQLEVIKKYGTQAAITDLCILTGCYLGKHPLNIAEDDSLTGRTSYFWTRSSSNGDYDDVVTVDLNGNRCNFDSSERNFAVRPVLYSPEIFSQISSKRVKGYNGTEEVEYGEYPQNAADSRMQNILELEYNRGMNKTGRGYTFCFSRYDYRDTKSKFAIYKEYEHQGKKYIRITARASLCFNSNKLKLSNGVEYRNGDYVCVWVEVSPVKWLIDDETETLISKYGLVSGIEFLDKRTNYKGDFDRTKMKIYLDKHMIHDLFQNIALIQTQTAINFEDKEQLDKLFLYETESNTKGKIKQLRFRAK